MSRKRKDHKDNWMPERVYKGKSAYEFHPKSGGAIRLCKLDEKHSAVWAAYEAIEESMKQRDSFLKLYDDFLASPQFAEKRKRTQQDYLKYKKPLIEKFGAMPPNAIQPKHVRSYLDYRANISGVVQSNRQKSAMQVIMGWGFERGRVRINPCVGIKKFKEVPRDVYVTDEQYRAVYQSACPEIQSAMEIAYLCMSRLSDVLNMTKDCITEEGLLIIQSKTSVAQLKTWGPRLRSAVKCCDEQHPSFAHSEFVIHPNNALKLTDNAFRNRWNKARQLAKKTFNIELNFSFHDLKAKGVSDFQGSQDEKRQAAGHTNVRQTMSYDRKPAAVHTVESKNKDVLLGSDIRKLNQTKK